MNPKPQLPDGPESEGDAKGEARRKVSFPRAIDPGWASVITALIALVGTLGVVLLSNGGQQANNPPPSTMAAEAAGAPSATPTGEPTATTPASPTPAPSATPTLAPTERPSETPAPPATATAEPAPQPTVHLLSVLPPAQLEAFQSAAAGVLTAAETLSLIMRDGFDSRDYAWPEFDETFAGGIQCRAAITDSLFGLRVQTTATSGPGWCAPFVPRTAHHFYLSLETQLLHDRNSDILLYYGWTDDYNFSYVMLQPQTQRLWLGVWEDGAESNHIAGTYIPAIDKTETNKLSLIVMGDQQVLYINDRLIAMIANTVSVEGSLRLGVRLNEADEAEELQIDEFVLRGQ